MAASDLILSVLGEAAAAHVSLSKTKLLKLLYLIDIELFRTQGHIATGWEWKFLHFGPWAHEYDPILQALAGEQRIAVVALAGAGQWETNLIRSQRSPQDLHALDAPAVRQAARRVLNRWLPQELPAILDHVYFETEPMRAAARGAVLNFDVVPREAPMMYTREPSSGGAAKLREYRRRLGLSDDGKKAPSSVVPAWVSFTPPVYDDAAVELLSTIDED